MSGVLIYDNHGNFADDLPFVYRVRLIEVEQGWQNVVKKLITGMEGWGTLKAPVF